MSSFSLPEATPSARKIISKYEVLNREQVTLTVKNTRKAFAAIQDDGNNCTNGGKKDGI